MRTHFRVAKMSHVFVCIAIVLVLASTAHAQWQSPGIQEQQISEEPRKTTISEISMQEELFKKSFTRRRREHLDAVRSLQKTDSYERLYKMIMVLAEKMFNVIESSKAFIEKAGFFPGNNSFPQDIKVRDALSTILENTALFGDIILHIPHITHRILKTQQKWNATVYWALHFTNQTRHLLDKGTLTMIHLVGQELNITTRDADYFNPYWPSSATQVKSEDASKKKKSSKKEKQKRGPQIVKIDL